MTETPKWDDRRQDEIDAFFKLMGLPTQTQRTYPWWEAGMPVEGTPTIKYVPHLSNTSQVGQD